jgi:hypothetical protein
MGAPFDVSPNFKCLAAQIATAARNSARAVAGCLERNGYDHLLVIARALLDREVLEASKCASAPFRLTEPGELVRVDLNINDSFPQAAEVRSPRMELKPFIKGVGKVRVDKSPEGIVVFRANDGQISRAVHRLTPESVSTSQGSAAGDPGELDDDMSDEL